MTHALNARAALQVSKRGPTQTGELFGVQEFLTGFCSRDLLELIFSQESSLPWPCLPSWTSSRNMTMFWSDKSDSESEVQVGMLSISKLE